MNYLHMIRGSYGNIPGHFILEMMMTTVSRAYVWQRKNGATLLGISSVMLRHFLSMYFLESLGGDSSIKHMK